MYLSPFRGPRALAFSLLALTLCASASASASEAVTYVTKTLVGVTANYEASFNGGPPEKVRLPIGAPDGGCPVHAKVRSSWPAGTNLTLKRKFYLPEGARKVRVNIGISDTAYVFINGWLDDLGVIVEWRCPEVGLQHGVEADMFVRPGVNEIEINAFGDENRFVALTITAEVPVDGAEQEGEPLR